MIIPNPSRTSKLTTSRPKPFNISILLRTILRGLKEVSSKAQQQKLPRTNSSKTTFKDCFAHLKRRFEARRYPKNYMERSTLTQDNRLLNRKSKKIAQTIALRYYTNPAVRKKELKIVMENWSLIETQPLLRTIFKMPPIRSYKRGKSLKDMLVRANYNFDGFDNATQPQNPQASP